MKIIPAFVSGWAKIQNLSTGGSVTGDTSAAQAKDSLVGQMLGILSDPKAIWMMDGSAATINDEYTGGHDATLQGTSTLADRGFKGSGFSLDFNGTDDYASVPDSADFTFGDGATDSAFSIIGVFYFDTATDRALVSKFDNTTGSKQTEWQIFIQTSGRIFLTLRDNSADVSTSRQSTAGITDGWYFLVATYDGTGGATAADGIKLYLNGIEEASTANNNASYVAMENTTANVFLGARTESSGSVGSLWKDGLPMVAVEGSELTAAQVYQLWKLVQGTYAL